MISNGKWRSRRDSNPRDGFPPAPLAGACLRPLGHSSADPFNGADRAGQEGKAAAGSYRGRAPARRWAKPGAQSKSVPETVGPRGVWCNNRPKATAAWLNLAYWQSDGDEVHRGAGWRDARTIPGARLADAARRRRGIAHLAYGVSGGNRMRFAGGEQSGAPTAQASGLSRHSLTPDLRWQNR